MIDLNKDPATFSAAEIKVLERENPGLAKTVRALQETLSEQGFSELEEHQRNNAIAHQQRLVKEYSGLNTLMSLGMKLTSEEYRRYDELREEIGVEDMFMLDADGLSRYLDKLHDDADFLENHNDKSGRLRELYGQIDTVTKELYEDYQTEEDNNVESE